MFRMYSVLVIVTLTVGTVPVLPAFAQEPAQSIHNGKIFRVPGGDGAIWLIDRGQRRHIHAGAWKAMFNNPGIEEIRQSDLEKLFSPGQPVKDGSFIARHKDGAMFWIDDGKKREIKGMQALRRYRFSEIHFVAKTAEEIAAYPNGDPIEPPPPPPPSPNKLGDRP